MAIEVEGTVAQPLDCATWVQSLSNKDLRFVFGREGSSLLLVGWRTGAAGPGGGEAGLRLAMLSFVAAAPGWLVGWKESQTSLEAHAGAEPQGKELSSRLSWLRAGVLGANDGIVSVAAIVVGVASVSSAQGPVLTAGMAGLVGGAVSMALGEYVSVSSQSDSQRAVIELKRRELAERPGEKLSELAGAYRRKGLSEYAARRVAEELTTQNALQAHLSVDLHADDDES